MCRAYFEPVDAVIQPRPKIRASIVFPRLELGHEIDFLLDTGADRTTFSRVDSIFGGFHPMLLNDGVDVREQKTNGVGGESTIHIIEEPAILAFEEFDEERERYSLHIEHLSPIQVADGCQTNLLGRDIIHRFEMDYNPVNGYVEMVRDNFGGGRYQIINSTEELSPSLRSFDDDAPV